MPEATNTSILAIATIMKNEGPYILEWVAYHRALGVDKIFIADNDSNDGSTEILKQLNDAGLITYIPFPHVRGEAPQLKAYLKILETYGSEADWFAFIDADEFLSPTDDDKSLVDIMSNVPDDVGAIAVNWAVYGSSFREEPGSGLVLDRFMNRANQSIDENKHYKTILRSIAFQAVGKTPHHFDIKPGYKFIYPNGNVVDYLEKDSFGLSKNAEWSILRLNHYVIKSKKEFFLKKTKRGRATTFLQPRDIVFFNCHDRNEVADPLDKRIIRRVKDEINKLSGLIKIPPHLESVETSIAYDEKQRSKTAGSIDIIKNENGIVNIIGWCVIHGVKADDFTITIDDEMLKILNVDRIYRDDVAKLLPGVEPYCGFTILADVSSIEYKNETLLSIKLATMNSELILTRNIH